MNAEKQAVTPHAITLFELGGRPGAVDGHSQNQPHPQAERTLKKQQTRPHRRPGL